MLAKLASHDAFSEPTFSERVRGIEPPSQPWEGYILPLNHTRIFQS